ncbi:MAG: hypothetical protein Q8K78_06010 [Planctomycetaceae bacterium]|nr:hypothetical protein [Planctomycetaceae bacterium]
MLTACRLTAKGHLTVNPAIGLPRLNCETEVRRPRRARGLDEFGHRHRRVHFVVDEAAALGHLEIMEAAVDKFRG